MQAQRVILTAYGPPNVMQLQRYTLPALAADEVLVKQEAIGFNYIDLSQRSGQSYKLNLPSGIGHEAAGKICAIGAAVSDFKIGDRVAYMNAGIGAYADYRNLPAAKMLKLPATISTEQAASLLFKGLTAQYLVQLTYPVKEGDLVLIHAAASNVGQILCQWSKALGAFVVGTIAGAKHYGTAMAAGCDVVLDQAQTDWPEQMLLATDGRKANVVYDAVGKDTFLQSLDCTAQFGTVVLYGAISGPAPQIDPELLNNKGCLYLTRPSVFAHNATTQQLRANATQLFTAISQGLVVPGAVSKFKLADVVAVHQQIEARTVTGAVVFIP